MVIPDEVAWGGLVTFGGFLATWLARQDRRINARLTREEHSKICDTKHKEVTEALSRIQAMVQQEASEAAAYRRETTTDIHRIDKRVAVLKATLGQPDDPNDEGEGA